jgi:CDP-paratose 2-epimerase
LQWLQQHHQINFINGDVRDHQTLSDCLSTTNYELIIHLAAQVAVTHSVTDPREDFEINALGTFNLLEAMRQHNPDAFFINASTNKVYGELEGVSTYLSGNRYYYTDHPEGINESQPLDFHSPYGCSKGAADQYTLDYGRIYNLRTVSMRQSCIYGERQFGIEDQGWVAWFAICAVKGQPIKLYGDGKQ